MIFRALVGLTDEVDGIVALPPADWETRDPSERCVEIYRLGLDGWASSAGLGNQTPSWARRATETAKGYPVAFEWREIEITTVGEAWMGSFI